MSLKFWDIIVYKIIELYNCLIKKEFNKLQIKEKTTLIIENINIKMFESLTFNATPAFFLLVEDEDVELADAILAEPVADVVAFVLSFAGVLSIVPFQQ